MNIIKLFDIILNINNINDLYTKDVNQKLLELINQKYLYKCFMECYIININKIINRSLIESNQNDLNCGFNVFIQFEATCIIYNKNEVILDMVIQEKINNNIITTKNIIFQNNKLNNDNNNDNNTIIAIIKNNNDINIFEKNNKIPIIIGNAKFTLGSDKIVINSFPFIPNPFIDLEPINKNCYFISEITTTIKEQLNDNIIKYIIIEENIKKQILSIKDNTWNEFKILIYPYKINTSEQLIKKYNTKKLINLDFNNSIINYYSQLDLSNGLICIFDKDNNSDLTYIKDDTYLILYDLLKKYYLYLSLINNLSTCYNTTKLISENNKIFDLYSKYKK